MLANKPWRQFPQFHTQQTPFLGKACTEKWLEYLDPIPFGALVYKQIPLSALSLDTCLVYRVYCSSSQICSWSRCPLGLSGVFIELFHFAHTSVKNWLLFPDMERFPCFLIPCPTKTCLPTLTSPLNCFLHNYRTCFSHIH